MNASSPAWIARPGRGRSPAATCDRAWMHVAVISGATTKKLTTVGITVSAVPGLSS